MIYNTDTTILEMSTSAPIEENFKMI